MRCSQEMDGPVSMLNVAEPKVVKKFNFAFHVPLGANEGGFPHLLVRIDVT